MTREKAVRKEVGSLLARISDGSLLPLLAYGIESKRKLNPEELETLRKLLDQGTQPK